MTLALRDGRATFAGLHTCQSVWECAVCASAIKAERAQEVGRVVELWKGFGGRCYMGTLTVRHRDGHRLADLAAGLMKAFERFQSGREWLAFREACGGLQMVRSVEMTHGLGGRENGWHPHLHVLFLTPRDIDNHPRMRAFLDARRWVDAWGDEHRCPDVQTWAWARWEACVRRELGHDHVPSMAHGLDLREAKRAEYISKLGLELTNPAESKRGGRSPFGLLELAAGGDERAIELWREFVTHAHGKRFLGWSRGLAPWRALALIGLPEAEEPQPVATIPGHEWDRLRDLAGFRASVLDAVERGELGPVLNRWRAAARFYETGPPC